MSKHDNEEDRFESDWHKACAPDSPLNSGVEELREFCMPSAVVADIQAEVDSFVAAHGAAMDICEHPSVRQSTLQ